MSARVPALALRMLLRDWRAGELRVLAAALVVAVAAVTAVGFFSDRIRLALELQATELLGADLVISSDHPVDAALLGQGGASLRRAAAVEFPSMVIAGEQSQLASLRAVSPDYPLRGNLRISRELFAPDAAAEGIPPAGSAWLESRLASQLGVAVGDAVEVGDARLAVAAILTAEPAGGGIGMFNLAPRLLFNAADLAATGLVQPASRVRYRYLFAGEPGAVRAFRAGVAPALGRGERLESVEDARPEVRGALDRAGRFLGLATLVSVLLSGVAVALSARRFIARHLDYCAVMRCLGASQRLILGVYGLQLGLLGLAAALLGCALGYLAQFGLEVLLGGLIGIDLPPPSARPALFGAGVALVTLLGFALPPLLHLRNVPALRVIRRELGGPGGGMRLLSYVAAAAAMAALVWWQAEDRILGLYVLLGAVAALALLAAAAAALIALLRQLRHRVGSTWRFGLLSLTQRAGTGVVQVMAFGLGIMVLLLLAVVRGDLLREWERELPAQAPNRFLINILPEQVGAVREFFARSGLQAPELFPMVRGRLTEVGGRAVSADLYADDRARRLVEREFNLSWAERMQDDNRIVAGAWWGAAETGAALMSVEAGLARTLGIGLGDTLAFRIAGTELRARVANLREVEWDNFRVNFFVLTPPGVLEPFPATWITSLYVPADRYAVLNELVRAFPNITVIDVSAIMDQVRGIMDRVALAVQYVFLFTLVAGLLVMVAAIHASLDERVRESVLLRTLGAGRRQLLFGLATEFVSLGVLSGLLGAFAAGMIAQVLAEQVFQLNYGWDPALWLIGALGGGLGVGLAGVLATRFVLSTPPIQALRGL
ncbi:MAG: FtsX-like permease family protein [Gammaproteobacteria bacterium]|nr:FtsX-like permease family protein [Gammaproteobacteria bacterium]